MTDAVIEKVSPAFIDVCDANASRPSVHVLGFTHGVCWSLPFETVALAEDKVVVIVCGPLPTASTEKVCVFELPESIVNDLLAVVSWVSENWSPADSVTTRSTLALPVDEVSFVIIVRVVLESSVIVDGS